MAYLTCFSKLFKRTSYTIAVLLKSFCMKAKRSTVKIGHIELNGYLTEEGAFGLSLADVARLCGIEPKQSSPKILSNKKVKALAAKGFETTKNIQSDNLRLTLIPLDWVVPVMQCLAFSGNALAEELLLTLAGLSLQKLFCDAFGQKFETEEMQQWLLVRTQGIEKRNQWTDAIKDYMLSCEVSETYKQWIYCNISDRLNLALTGHKAKYWCDKLECPPSRLRDFWSDDHLANINSIEKHATVLTLRGVEPKEALESAISFFQFPVNDHPEKVYTASCVRMRALRSAAPD